MISVVNDPIKFTMFFFRLSYDFTSKYLHGFIDKLMARYIEPNTLVKEDSFISD